MTRSDRPRPKLRVTLRSSTPFCPHAMQRGLDTVDGDEEEGTKRGDFDDCFGVMAPDRETADDELDLARFPVTLSFDDFARKDDIFEIEDCEFVIVKFFRGMNGYGIVE